MDNFVPDPEVESACLNAEPAIKLAPLVTVSKIPAEAWCLILTIVPLGLGAGKKLPEVVWVILPADACELVVPVAVPKS